MTVTLRAEKATHQLDVSSWIAAEFLAPYFGSDYEGQSYSQEQAKTFAQALRGLADEVRGKDYWSSTFPSVRVFPWGQFAGRDGGARLTCLIDFVESSNGFTVHGLSCPMTSPAYPKKPARLGYGDDIYLERGGARHEVNVGDWRAAEELAGLHGFEGEPDNLRYDSTEAFALADALERAAERVPADDDWADKCPFDMGVYGHFAGSAKRRLLALYNFVRRGAFQVMWPDEEE